MLINVFATQFSMADISFNIAPKELKNAQIAQVNHYSFNVWIYFANTATGLWVKSNANEEKCKQWCQQRFTYQLHVLGNKISYIAIMFQFVILLKFWGHLHVILLVSTGLELQKSSGCLLATRCRFVVTSWNNLNDSAHSMAWSIRFDCLKISETEVGINLYR